MLPHLRYLWYVLKHKWFVFYAGVRLGGIPLWRLVIHDWTKFTPAEWFPYVEYFYGANPIQRDKTGYYHAGLVGGSFDAAWNHHQKHNPHHWQYWILLMDNDEPRVKTLPMPRAYAREMVADWIGAGRAQGKPDCEAWYLVNKDKITLSDDTRHCVEQFINEAKQKGIIP